MIRGVAWYHTGETPPAAVEHRPQEAGNLKKLEKAREPIQREPAAL